MTTRDDHVVPLHPKVTPAQQQQQQPQQHQQQQGGWGSGGGAPPALNQAALNSLLSSMQSNPPLIANIARRRAKRRRRGETSLLFRRRTAGLTVYEWGTGWCNRRRHGGLCVFFNTPQGCRHGNQCKFRHELGAGMQPPLPPRAASQSADATRVRVGWTGLDSTTIRTRRRKSFGIDLRRSALGSRERGSATTLTPRSTASSMPRQRTPREARGAARGDRRARLSRKMAREARVRKNQTCENFDCHPTSRPTRLNRHFPGGRAPLVNSRGPARPEDRTRRAGREEHEGRTARHGAQHRCLVLRRGG